MSQQGAHGPRGVDTPSAYVRDAGRDSQDLFHIV